MKKIIFNLSKFALLILIFGALIFIYRSNDHKECGTVSEKCIGVNGEITEIERHVCEEKYSF